MSRQSQRPLVDRILGGRLDEMLQQALDGVVSFHRLSIDLFTQHELEISPETLRRWAREMATAA